MNTKQQPTKREMIAYVNSAFNGWKASEKRRDSIGKQQGFLTQYVNLEQRAFDMGIGSIELPADY